MFKALQINDYSMLLGIHYLTGPNEGEQLFSKSNSEII